MAMGPEKKGGDYPWILPEKRMRAIYLGEGKFMLGRDCLGRIWADEFPVKKARQEQPLRLE